jgi:dethiobiotin synthetase
MSRAGEDGGFVLVAGTDTGAGKTLLTALLLVQARENGRNVLATKPFCSGDRADLDLLDAAQDGRLPPRLLNVFHSPTPVAPLVAARLAKKKISLKQVVERIREAKSFCDQLLIEGAGGLLAPLGERYSALDLIKQFRCPVLLAARNRLGVINHVLLIGCALQQIGIKHVTVVLMGCQKPDISTHSNARILRELMGSARVFEVPCLGGGVDSAGALKKSAKKIKKTLALIWGCVKTSPVNRTPKRGVERKTGQRRKCS